MEALENGAETRIAEQVAGKEAAKTLETEQSAVEAKEEPTALVPVIMTKAYSVSSDRHKELASAISWYTSKHAQYQKAPTFAFLVGKYTIDKAGTMTGPMDQGLLDMLAGEGFKAEQTRDGA